MHQHWLFVCNVLAHLVASMSGVASFLMAAWEQARNKKIESKIFFFVGVICLVVAFDQAWNDEHRNSEVLIAEKSSLYVEKEFWKQQSYEKDASLRQRDDMLVKNYTALTSEQGASSSAQKSLADLSQKILELDKPLQQKYTVRSYLSEFSEEAKKYHHLTQFIVLTNLPAPAEIQIKCQYSFTIIDARIIEGGPVYPNSFKRLQSNEWAVHIPAPQVTPTNPFIITLAHDADRLGICTTDK